MLLHPIHHLILFQLKVYKLDCINFIKYQLQTLLNQGETHLLNLRKKNGTQTAEVKNTTNTSTVKEVNETSENDDDYSLLKEIEEEIMDHALNPLEEFHVKPTKTSEEN